MWLTYGTPCHASGHSHTQAHMWLRGHHATPEVTLHISMEADDFPRGDRHFKHAPLPTYLICLSPKGLYW